MQNNVNIENFILCQCNQRVRMSESPIIKVLCWILAIVTVIGAVNWIFYANNNDLVLKLSKKSNTRKAIYTSIGVCGILFFLFKVLYHSGVIGSTGGSGGASGVYFF